MDTCDEWYYEMLLDMLKQKEQEKQDANYIRIELEIPLEQKPEIEEKTDEPKIERGVTIIDL